MRNIIALGLGGAAAAAVALAVGCTIQQNNAQPDAGAGAGAEPTRDAAASRDAAALDAVAPRGEWTLRAHGCPGPNRTDALFDDEDGHLWVGCGTNASGYGLFTSDDDGATWSKVKDSPTLDQFRVDSIERGPDGALYVAGANDQDGSGNRVVKLNTSSKPFTVTPVLVAVNKVGRAFTVGTFRLLPDGAAVAESLTGTDALFRASASVGASADAWLDVSAALSGGLASAEQVLDLAVHDGKLYGAGSRISEPPYVFIGGGGAPYELQRVQLPRADGAWSGEMWGIAASADRVVVVGENQVAHTGRIYVGRGNLADPASYREKNLSEIIGNASTYTWARGVCQRGARVVVVGERQPLTSDSGLVVLSDDGGETFVNVTPDAVTDSVSKCNVRADGTVVVTGAAGFVGFYR